MSFDRLSAFFKTLIKPKHMTERRFHIEKIVHIPGVKFGGGSEAMEECQKTFCSSCEGLPKIEDGDLNLDNGLTDNLEDGLADEEREPIDSTVPPDISEPDPDTAARCMTTLPKFDETCEHTSMRLREVFFVVELPLRYCQGSQVLATQLTY